MALPLVREIIRTAAPRVIPFIRSALSRGTTTTTRGTTATARGTATTAGTTARGTATTTQPGTTASGLFLPGAGRAGTGSLITAPARTGTVGVVRPGTTQTTQPFGMSARERAGFGVPSATPPVQTPATSALREFIEEAAVPAVTRTGLAQRGLAAASRVIPSGKAGSALGLAAAAAPGLVNLGERYVDFARQQESGTTQAPQWLDRAAAAAQLAGFAIPGAAAAAKAASKSLTTGQRLGRGALAAALGGGLAITAPSAVRTLTQTPPPVDAAAAGAVPPEEPPIIPIPPLVGDQESQMEQVQRMQEEALLAYEQQLVQEDQALDALYQQAIDEAIAARGATTQADLAADPLLQQELAAINQQYTSAKQNIQDNYAAALNQVQGYQTQADQLMQELAAAQLAGIETAAGQAMAPAPGTGLSAEEAAAAGLSQTAVGGAGTTGAAILGGMGGVTSAQLAAQRVAAGSLLAEQLASGRLDQAAVETALEQALVDAERGARVTAAERQAREREVRRQQNIEAADMRLRAAESRRAETASKREAIAAARLQNNQRLADRIAGMSAEEYRRFVGGDVTTVSPAWAKSRISPPAKGTGESTGVVPGFPAASVDDANTVLQLFETEMGNILATNQDRATAINSIARWIIDVTNTYGVDARAVLRAAGHPVTPEEIYNKLAPQR